MKQTIQNAIFLKGLLLARGIFPHLCIWQMAIFAQRLEDATFQNDKFPGAKLDKKCQKMTSDCLVAGGCWSPGRKLTTRLAQLESKIV